MITLRSAFSLFLLAATSTTANGRLAPVVRDDIIREEPVRLPPTPTPPPTSPPPPPTPTPPLKEIRDPIRWPPPPSPTPPPTPPPPTPPPTPPSSPKIVTLGDSYSSGTGLYQKGHQYDEEHGGYVAPWKLTARSDNECWRETGSIAGPRYASSVGRPSLFLACKGATLVSDAGTSSEFKPFANQIDYMNSLYPGDAAAKWAGSTILFTIGGNDIRTVGGQSWPELVQTCITESSCEEKWQNQVGNWQAVADRLEEAYEKLATDAGNARVKVMGYPRLFQRHTAWYYPDKCPGVSGVGKDEADFFDDLADELNSIMSGEVNAVRANHPGFDIEFVPVTSYITRGACRTFNREVNDKVCLNHDTDACFNSSGISDSSFHPSRRGYDKYEDAFLNSL